MARGTIFSGESKNIEYKITLPDKSEKVHENNHSFCQYSGRKADCSIDDKTHEIVGVTNENIISVNGWNCQCYFRFLYAADYSGY